MQKSNGGLQSTSTGCIKLNGLTESDQLHRSRFNQLQWTHIGIHTFEPCLKWRSPHLLPLISSVLVADYDLPSVNCNCQTRSPLMHWNRFTEINRNQSNKSIQLNWALIFRNREKFAINIDIKIWFSERISSKWIRMSLQILESETFRLEVIRLNVEIWLDGSVEPFQPKDRLGQRLVCW